MSKEYPLNDMCIRLLHRLTGLQRAFQRFTEPTWFWFQPRPREIAEFCRLTEDARSDFWLAVYTQYPFTRGLAMSTVGDTKILVDEAADDQA